MLLKRIFCVTTYVTDDKNRFVLLLHRKLGKWVPPGGKIDPHETPKEAAIRECYEETGLHVELIGKTPRIEGVMMPPLGVQLNTIIPGEQEHVDLIYRARSKGERHLTLAPREAKDIGWFSYQDVLELATFPSVVSWCKAIALNESE